MQKVFAVLSGNSPLFSFLLIIAAALPLSFLLVSTVISVVKEQPGIDNDPFKGFIQISLGVLALLGYIVIGIYYLLANIVAPLLGYKRIRGFIQISLGVLALLGYIVIGIYSLQAPQSAVQLTLHLGGIFGLALGIIICVMVKMGGKLLFWGLLTVIAFPGVALYNLYQLIKAWFVALKTGQDREPIYPLSPSPAWTLLLRGSLTLIYGGWAGLIAHQTHSPAIGLWSTLIAALVSVLILFYFILSISVPDFFKEDRPFSPLQVCYFIEYISQLCMLALSTLLPLIILAFIGGLIGSFLT